MIRDRENPDAAVDWLFENAPRMSPEMFLADGWEKIGPLELSILRVCSPKNVFTTAAKSDFLVHIQDDGILYQVANAAFGNSDSDFLLNLPNGLRQYRPKLKALMRSAYDSDIRVEDPKVFGQ